MKKTTFTPVGFNPKTMYFAVDKYNKENNNILAIGLKKGLIIEVFKGYFMSKKHFESIEDYVNKYRVIWHNSSFRDATDKEVKEWYISWENYTAKRVNNIADEVGTSNREFNRLIGNFVDKINLQPYYYHNALKQYPDSLPHNEKIYKRYSNLSSESEFRGHYPKYMGPQNTVFEKIKLLLSKQDKKTLQDVKLIISYTDRLISTVDPLLYDSPTMIQFVDTMFNLKQYYDFEKENKGLPRMNRYFKDVDKDHFKVDSTPVEILTGNNEDKDTSTKQETEPPTMELHDLIFRNNGFVLFEYLMNNHVEKILYDGRHADISHYYRKMVKDNKYIRANITVFIDWFNHTYNEQISKIKTINSEDRKTGARNSNYTTALSWFKQQKNDVLKTEH